MKCKPLLNIIILFRITQIEFSPLHTNHANNNKQKVWAWPDQQAMATYRISSNVIEKFASSAFSYDCDLEWRSVIYAAIKLYSLVVSIILPRLKEIGL